MPNIIDTLVTDRKWADVRRAYYLESLWGPDGAWTGTPAELAEVTGDLRGEYKYQTLNRVERAVEFVASLIRARGYEVTIAPCRTWTRSDIPTYEELERYLGNISAIREAVAHLPTTPPVPENMDVLTTAEANAIEQILLDVHTICMNIVQAFIYTGMTRTGTMASIPVKGV